MRQNDRKQEQEDLKKATEILIHIDKMNQCQADRKRVYTITYNRVTKVVADHGFEFSG